MKKTKDNKTKQLKNAVTFDNYEKELETSFENGDAQLCFTAMHS